MNNSSNQQVIIFFPPYTMSGCADDVCDCCKNDCMKNLAPSKERKEKKANLNKLT